ncbi:hypothetical protein TNCV_2618391 [Trichonephila clavipes]|nr:hypothetical protein TNCV_2618391 [Trichonephila clavipes]
MYVYDESPTLQVSVEVKPTRTTQPASRIRTFNSDSGPANNRRAVYANLSTATMVFCFSRYILEGVQRVVQPMGAEVEVASTTKGIRSSRGLALSLIVDAVRPKMAVR